MLGANSRGNAPIKKCVQRLNHSANLVILGMSFHTMWIGYTVENGPGA